MKFELDVAIIGAGPYGLSIAAFLNSAGIENRIFGVPMESWRDHMPRGMFLKSYGESSDLFDPRSGFTLKEFCKDRGIEYHDSKVPVSLETFVAYGRAFQERFVPRVEQKRLVALTTTDRGHELLFDNGNCVTARHVVLAIGVVPYKFMPTDLAGLPVQLASHSSDYGPLDRLAGREITVVGSGSSALDIAALLSMRGSAVTVVARSPELHYQTPPGPDPSFLRRVISPPANGLGAGWLLSVCARAPRLIHFLPDDIRCSILSNTLGPSGGYFIRDQVERNVTLRVAHAIERAEERGGRVRLTTVDRSGARETIESDHLVAATGYKVDLRRLGFLGDETLNRLRMIDHTPILSSDFESSVPGLYFVGLSSARSFGPVMRFVVGALHPARRLARVLRRPRVRPPDSVSATIAN